MAPSGGRGHTASTASQIAIRQLPFYFQQWPAPVDLPAGAFSPNHAKFIKAIEEEYGLRRSLLGPFSYGSLFDGIWMRLTRWSVKPLTNCNVKLRFNVEPSELSQC